MMKDKRIETTEQLKAINEALMASQLKLNKFLGEFFFWGILIMVSGLIHYWIITNNLPRWYIALNYLGIFGFAMLITNLRYALKGKKMDIQFGSTLKVIVLLGVFTGVNMALMGVFHSKWGDLLMAVELLFFSAVVFAWAAIYRNIALVLGGVLVAALGHMALFIEATYHPLLFAASGLVGLVLPAIIMKISLGTQKQ